MFRNRRLSTIIAILTLMLVPDSKAQSKFKTLHAFDGEDGLGPDYPLIFDKAGNLYGTTFSGGTDKSCTNCGVAYELTPQSDGNWTEKVLHQFVGGKDGLVPTSGLIFDPGTL